MMTYDFLVDSWKNGRGDWERYEKRRRAIIVNAPPQLNEEFDKAFLQALCDGKTEDWLETISELAMGLMNYVTGLLCIPPSTLPPEKPSLIPLCQIG